MNLGAPKHLPPLAYYALAVNGEAGELAEKVKKIFRDQDGHMTDEDKEAIIDEGGDMLWYLTRICETLGTTLGAMARRNIVKLEGRIDRGTTRGSGDRR